jgi:uncharacterized protein (DUF58 family)
VSPSAEPRTGFDIAAVERAAAGRSLRLPRVPQRGRIGEVRSASVGSSLELHDFRLYHPGDDVRHLDWNAVARTGELVLRVRQDEVSPRLELLFDASLSMAVSPEKAARAREVADLVATLGRRAGLEVVLVSAGRSPQRAVGAEIRSVLSHVPLDGAEAFDVALKRAPPLTTCGLRVVVSDFLFESDPERLAERWARGTTALYLLQVLDAEDLEPSGGAGARLLDSESGEALERVLTTTVLETYAQRFTAHQRLWRHASARVHAQFATASAAFAVDALAANALAPVLEAA